MDEGVVDVINAQEEGHDDPEEELPNDESLSPLHAAVETGDLSRVQALVDDGADIEQAQGVWAQTPLYRAAEKGHVAVARYLVERGANKEATAYNRQTPLHVAVLQGKRVAAEDSISFSQRKRRQSMRAFTLSQQLLLLLLRLPLLCCVRCAGGTTVELQNTVRADFTCRDPFLSGPTSTGQGLNRKWLALGLVKEGTGLGNLLLFFPAVYYFAAFSSREIVLLDTSNIGLFCQVSAWFSMPHCPAAPAP